MRLLQHAPRLGILKLPPGSSIPTWSQRGGFCSTTRTSAELSIVCESEWVPSGVKSSGPWVRLEVEGPLPFSLAGVLAELTAPLAAAEVSVFPIATYDTDHLLIRIEDVDKAHEALTDAGHRIAQAKA